MSFLPDQNFWIRRFSRVETSSQNWVRFSYFDIPDISDSYRDYLTFTKRASFFFSLNRAFIHFNCLYCFQKALTLINKYGVKIRLFYWLDFAHHESPTVIVGNIVNAIFEEFNQLTINLCARLGFFKSQQGLFDFVFCIGVRRFCIFFRFVNRLPNISM
jgi:hypothetical protein